LVVAKFNGNGEIYAIRMIYKKDLAPGQIQEILRDQRVGVDVQGLNSVNGVLASFHDQRYFYLVYVSPLFSPPRLNCG
jgi:hypothetical protein